MIRPFGFVAVMGLPQGLSEERVAAMFENMDLDKDGTIDFAEFLNALAVTDVIKFVAFFFTILSPRSPMTSRPPPAWRARGWGRRRAFVSLSLALTSTWLLSVARASTCARLHPKPFTIDCASTP